jgi:hypothetical protein
MTRRIRIPGVIDLVRLDEPPAIDAVSEDARLDRDFAGPGPLLNRWIARRVRRNLRVDGKPLPSVAPRGYTGRAENQASLERELSKRLADNALPSDQVDRLAAYIRGDIAEDALGPIAQEAIGRLFVKSYAATNATWRSALVFDAAPRTMNPFQLLAWHLSGAIERSRDRLARAVDGNPAGVHATGIAVHSQVRSLRAMRELWLEPGVRDRTDAEAAVTRSLRAPKTALRRWSAPASTVHGEMRPGTLTMFELEKANTRRPGPEMVFMTDSWSYCPAYRWITSLLLNVWQRAAEVRAPR